MFFSSFFFGKPSFSFINFLEENWLKELKVWINTWKVQSVQIKNPAYGRHQVSQPMRIVGPIQIWRGCVIYLFLLFDRLREKFYINFLRLRDKLNLFVLAPFFSTHLPAAVAKGLIGKNIARVAKRCPESWSVVKVWRCFFTKRCHYNYFCHYCHFYNHHNLSFWVFTIWFF